MSPIRALVALENGVDARQRSGGAARPAASRCSSGSRPRRRSRPRSRRRADLLIVACSAKSGSSISLIERVTKLAPERPVVVLQLDGADSNGFMQQVFAAGADDIVALPEPPERIRHCPAEGDRAQARSDAGAGLRTGVAHLRPRPEGRHRQDRHRVQPRRRARRAGTAHLPGRPRSALRRRGARPPSHARAHDLRPRPGGRDARRREDRRLPHRPRIGSAGRCSRRPGRTMRARSGPTFISEVLALLRSISDFVVVDTPAGFPSEVITAVDSSTDICVVGMLDAFSLKDTKLGLETLDRMGYDRDSIRLVLNRADTHVGIGKDDVTAILDREPDVLVPSQREIPRSVTEGKPIVAAQPKSTAAKAFRTLASHVHVHPGASSGSERVRAVPGTAPEGSAKEGVDDGTPRADQGGPGGRGREQRPAGRPVRRAEDQAAPRRSSASSARSSTTPVGTTKLLHDRVVTSIRERLAAEAGLSRDDRTRLQHEIQADILAYGPIEPLLADETHQRDHDQRPLRRLARARRSALQDRRTRFNDESHLRRIINKMVGQVGRRIDESSPMVDARLPDGSRVNAIIPPLSLTGPLVTIRKFHHKRFFLDDLIAVGTLSEQAADVPQALHPRRAEHPDLGRHGHRQDDPAERALGGDPGRPADRDDRGRGRAAA